jgi:hypothetical protein
MADDRSDGPGLWLGNGVVGLEIIYR